MNIVSLKVTLDSSIVSYVYLCLDTKYMYTYDTILLSSVTFLNYNEVFNACNDTKLTIFGGSSFHTCEIL